MRLLGDRIFIMIGMKQMELLRKVVALYFLMFAGYNAHAQSYQNTGDANPCINGGGPYSCGACLDPNNPIQNFTWVTPGSDICTASPAGTTIYIIWKKPGTYDINATWDTGTAQNLQHHTGLFMTVTVHDAITVTASASPTAANPGEAVTLTASGATTYTWSGPGLVFNANATVIAQFPDNATQALYSVVGTSGSCSANASVTVLKKKPDAGPDRTVCKNSSPLDLSTVGPSLSAGTWSSPSGSITNGFIDVPSLAVGQYTFTYTRTSDGLSDSMVLTVVESVGGTIAIAYNTSACNTVSGSLTAQYFDGAVQQWDRSYDNGANWYSIPSSANVSNIAFSENQQALFRASVVKNGCALAYSTPASVKPANPVGGNLSPSDITITCGRATGNLSLDSYTGDQLSWEYSNDGTTWNGLNASTNQYAFDVTAPTYFRVKVVQSTTTCDPQYSTAYVVNTASSGGVTSVNSSSQCATASGQINLSNYVGSIQQWQYSKDGSTWTTIANSAGVSPLAFTTSQPVNYYRAVVQLNNCTVDYSSVATVTVSPQTNPGVVRLDSEPTFDNATGKYYATFRLDNNNGQIVQWRTETNGQIAYQSVTARYFSIYLQQTTSVRAQVQNGSCDALLSGEVIFVVNQPSLGILQIVDGLQVSEYSGYSYQIKTTEGLTLSDGFSFYANAGQSFFALLDDNYSLPQDENYFLAETILESGLATEDDLYFANAFQRQSVYTYYDGLSRKKQTVNRRGNPSQQDIVTPITYDLVGRQDKDYLPYASDQSNGYLVSDAITSQSNFYLSPPDKVSGTNFPYAQSIFESSPLDRLLEQGAPGEDWQPTVGHAVKYDYDVNSENEILMWTIDPSANLPVSTGYFSVGDLSVSITTDEHGSQVKEYRDKLGLVLIKRVQNRAEWIDTYYIYDDQSLLRFVIQPEGVKNLMYAPDQDFLDRWVFQYSYDSRRRIIKEKKPGAAVVYKVYDNRNRLVVTQDGNQRAKNEWTFTKYDWLNRPIVSGLYTHSGPVTQEQMAALISTDQFTESDDPTSSIGYTTNRVFPTENLQALAVNFYDDYSLLNTFGSNFQYDKDHLAGLPGENFQRVLGQITGTMTRILGTDTWLRQVVYFDSRYRQIQIVSENHLGGTDKQSYLVDFVGKVLTQKTTHQKPGDNDIAITEDFTYDHAGRLIAQYHQVDNGPKVNLKLQNFNALGQLVEKNLHLKDDGSYQQSVDYRYNIRGWLTSINNSQLTNDGITNDDGNDLYGMNISYNQQDVELDNIPLFNGGISAIKWSANLGLSDVKERAYNLSFDAMNRLTAATHMEKTLRWARSTSYHEDNISYDNNGNILSLNRKGASGVNLDQLIYTYKGNQLQTVSDAGDINKGFVDGNLGSTDYIYDAVGNVTTDKNKDITAITYNYLHFPQQVTKSTGDYEIYSYDANGYKLNQTVYNASNVLQKKTDYVGAFHYSNDTLKFIGHNEGRVIMTGTTPEYIYDIQDPYKNSNISFTSVTLPDVSIATFETTNLATEQVQFQRYDEARRINSILFDHTNRDFTGYSQRLNGTTNERDGLARSMSVMPGDKIEMEVYVKYVDTNSNDWTGAFSMLMGQIASNTSGFVVDGANYSSSASSFPYAGLLNTSGSTGTGPKAYMNWLIFDRNYVFKNGGYVRMSDVAKEYGQDCAHERLTSSFVVTEPGYVFVYLSNENDTPVEVYFDDWKITQTKSPIIQSDDFMPFGLTFNSYKREYTVPNKFLFHNKTELIDDLGLNVYQFHFRTYDPALGRFWSLDPLADKYYYNSPYAFAENKLGMGIELEGLELLDFGMLSKAVEFKIRTATSVSNIQSAAGNLASGNSGNVPKDVTMSGEDRQMVKVGSQISDAKTVTDGVKDIAKTGVRMGAEGAQTTGDAIETAGVLTGQPEIAAAGAAISTTGKVTEMALDASEGNLKAGDVAYEVGSRAAFGSMSSEAKQAVKAGNLDSKANDIFQGFVKGWNMIADWVKSKVDDKSNSNNNNQQH